MTGRLDLLLDTILPGDPDLGLPPGSAVDPTRPPGWAGLRLQLDACWAVLDQAAQAVGADDFAAARPEIRLKAIEKAKRLDMRLITALLIHCLRSYYSAPQVLACLHAGAVPPFPTGNRIAEDDWSILEPVYERGPIVRPLADEPADVSSSA